jgi:hypothetical protein
MINTTFTLVEDEAMPRSLLQHVHAPKFWEKLRSNEITQPYTIIKQQE